MKNKKRSIVLNSHHFTNQGYTNHNTICDGDSGSPAFWEDFDMGNTGKSRFSHPDKIMVILRLFKVF